MFCNSVLALLSPGNTCSSVSELAKMLLEENPWDDEQMPRFLNCFISDVCWTADLQVCLLQFKERQDPCCLCWDLRMFVPVSFYWPFAQEITFLS